MLKLWQAMLSYFLDNTDPAALRRQEIYARQQRWLDYLRWRRPGPAPSRFLIVMAPDLKGRPTNPPSVPRVRVRTH